MLGCLGSQQTGMQPTGTQPNAATETAAQQALAEIQLATSKNSYAAKETIPLEISIQNGKFDLLVPFVTVATQAAFINLTVTDINGEVVKRKRPITMENPQKYVRHQGKSVRCIQGFALKAGAQQVVSLEDLRQYYRMPAGTYTAAVEMKLEVYRESIVEPHPQVVELEQDIARLQRNTDQAALKQPMLAHLRKYHGVSTETIYNDIHGFIRTRDIHRSAYSEFYRGLTCQESVSGASPLEERQAAYAKAVAHYTDALTFKPDMAEAYNNRGTVYSSQDMFDLAISDYTAAIELELDFHVAYYNRGAAYLLKSDYDSAIENFNETIRVNPDFPDAYYNRAAAYLFNGELNSAITDYTRVIELDSGDTDAYYSRGIVRLQLQEWREAEADLTAARNKGMDIIAAFHKDYESIATFEEKFKVKLPEDITAMLLQS